MKTLRIVFKILLFVLCVMPLQLKAQNKEISITTSSKEAKDYFLLGRDKLENFNNTTATAFFDKAIETDPNFAIAYLYKAYSGGDFQERISYLDQAVKHSTNISEGEKKLILYFQAAMTGKSDLQKKYLHELLKEFPSDKRIWYEAGNYFYNNKDYKNALKHYNKSVAIDHKFAPSYNMIGYSESKLTNFDKAAKAFQTYIQLNPESPGGYDSYAELLLTMGNYDKSITQYKKALELDPHFSYSLIGLGNNYVFLGEYDMARKYYQEYFDNAQISAARYEALSLLATSYVHEYKIENALSVFDQYNELAKNENDVSQVVRGLANQGMIYIECGNPEQGKIHYDKAIAILKESEMNEAVKDYLMRNSNIWHLYAHIANGEFENAEMDEKSCMHNLEMSNNSNEKLLFKAICGYLDYKKGNFDSARKHFAKADTDDPIVQYYSALCYQNLGDLQEANRLFEKIISSKSNSLNLALVRNKALNRQTHNLAYLK